VILDNHTTGIDLHFWGRVLSAVSDKLQEVRLLEKAQFLSPFQDPFFSIQEAPHFPSALQKAPRKRFGMCVRIVFFYHIKTSVVQLNHRNLVKRTESVYMTSLMCVRACVSSLLFYNYVERTFH